MCKQKINEMTIEAFCGSKMATTLKQQDGPPEEEEKLLWNDAPMGRKKALEGAEMMLGKDKVLMCPYCFDVLGSKDDANSSTVTCSFCGKRFCSRCLAKAGPIMMHGNHYHRLNCDLYNEYKGEEQANPKCEECVKNGNKLCARPADLVNGDFPADEAPSAKAGS